MALKFRINKIWLIVLFFVAVIGIIYFIVVGVSPQSSVGGRLLRQEKAVAKAEAENIQDFFDNFGPALIETSQLPAIQNPGAETIPTMKPFVDKWGKNSLIAGLSLTDKNGIVIYNYSNLAPSQTGTDISDRDYFIWAKKQTKTTTYFIGDPVIARFGVNTGQYIVTASTPVFRDGVFSGALVSAVRLSNLATYYLGILKIDDSTDVYIIDDTGYVLFNHSQPESVGAKIDNFEEGNPFVDNKSLTTDIYRAITKGEDGSLMATYLGPDDTKPRLHAVAYYPVKFPEENWLIVLSSPATTISKATTPFYVNYIAMLSLLALLTFTLGSMILRNPRKR